MTDQTTTPSNDRSPDLSTMPIGDGETRCCGGGVSRLDNEQAVQLAGQLSALADPTRLQMLSIIASSTTGEVCACDFVDPIGKSQPTISHHLKVLNEAGLVTGDKRGRWIWYRLTAGTLGRVTLDLAEALASTTSSTRVDAETVRGS